MGRVISITKATAKSVIQQDELGKEKKIIIFKFQIIIFFKGW